MKKITSLLTLLLICCMGALAQEPSEFEGKSITVGGAVAKLEANTWYFLHQARVLNADAGTHSEVGELPQTGGFAYDCGTEHIKKSSLDAVPEGSAANAKAAYIVRFIESDDNKGAYKIQFGTGNYMREAPANGTGSSKYDAQDFNVYNINGEDGHFAINKWNMANILDNNGVNGTIVYWASGEVTSLNGNNDWAIHEVVWGDISLRDAAMAELQDVYGTYSTYTFEAGTTPGKYGVAEVEAFNNAMDAASEADGPGGASLTAEDLAKMAQDIKDTYEAVLASRVPYAVSITPGYYYIKSALDFKTTTTTEATEDPETGEEIPGEIIEIHHTKAMYTSGANGKWAELDETSRQDANYIWKITEAGDKKYHLINTQVDAQLNAIAQSANITLSEKSDSLVVFDASGLEGIYNIRVASQTERGYVYVHCGGHNGGAGVQGNLVGWCNTVEEGVAHGSEWQLEAIDEATALAIIEACSPAKQIKAMTDSAAIILAAAPATITIAQDKVTELDENTPLIADASQLYSPQTTNDTQKVDGEFATDEQVMAFLLDGNTSTYWHSAWEGGDRPNGADYIEISDIDAASVAFKMTRRAVNNDHITSASVYGYDEARTEATKEEGELLAEMNLPFGSNTETILSDVIPTKGHKVIRIYEESTTNNRGYWHMTEFQMYPASVSTPYATTQAKERAAEISALETAIEAWKAIDLAAVKQPAEIQAQFDALTKAYAAWQAVYVDPAALRQTIKNAPDTKVIKIGNNPGEWPSAEGTIAGLLASAQAYDESGLYTPAQSEKFINDLTKAQEDMFAAANKVKTGKWYNIRFATEAEYDEAGWNKNPAKEIVNEDANVETSHALFGKYITVVKHANETVSYTNAEGNEQKDIQYNVEELTSEDATFGAGVGFMAKQDIKEADAALWQFVAIGDSAYVLQNKATGLYMRTGTTGAVVMSVQPTTFNTSAIGFGKNLIKAVALNGANNNYLHAERATNNLVTWNATTIESNSALYIEEVADVTEQPTNEFTWSLWPGQVQTVCYPAELTAKEATLYTVSVEGTTVTLNPIKGNTVAAGKAAVMILGSTEDYEEIEYDEESENYNAENFELCTFTHGTSFVAAADTTGILRGAFVNTTIGSGNIWAEGNSMVLTKKSNNTLGANTAYVKAGITDLESTITLIVESEEKDAIQSAVANVSKTGNIYTVDGKFVGRGNLNNIKEKGIYIVNGVKVTVK